MGESEILCQSNVMVEMSPFRQEESLRRGEIDLALIGEPSPELRRDYHVVTIRRTELAMIVPDNHRLASRKSGDLTSIEALVHMIRVEGGLENQS